MWKSSANIFKTPLKPRSQARYDYNMSTMQICYKDVMMISQAQDESQQTPSSSQKPAVILGSYHTCEHGLYIQR